MTHKSILDEINLETFYVNAKNILRESLMWPPDRHAGEWAVKNLRIAPEYAEPGPYNPYRTPYVIPIFQAIASKKYDVITYVAGTQSSKTQIGLCASGHQLEDDPAPIIWISSTQKLGKKIGEKRFARRRNGLRRK